MIQPNFYIKTSLLILGLWLVSFISSAQFIGFKIENRSGRTSFPFEKVNNLIVVPVMLNETLPLNFILDSGVRTTILTDKSISDIINISYDRELTIAGAGYIRELAAYLATNVTLSLPGITGRGQSLIVLEEDYLGLGSHLGMNIHGIIGYEFFNHFVVQIDYDHKIVTVFTPEKFKPRRRFTPVPITLDFGRPYMEAQITQSNGSVINTKLLLDSGASHGLLLEIDSNDSIYMPEKRLETVIGWGLGGELSGYMARINQMDFGGFSFENVLVSLAKDYSDQEVNKLIGRNGTVGGELLGRFTTIYDYSSKVVYFRRNRGYSQPFEFNLSGVDLVATAFTNNAFRIINIIENSPADEAGLQPGDLVLAINGKFSYQYTLSEINTMLRERPGNRISMTINRNDEVKRVNFRLRRMI
jgi:hypothetical protein